MKLKRILIVDDSAPFRTMVKSYLQKNNLNFEIYEASTSEMGLAKASCIKPHIVLMDINIPHVNGIVTAKHIKVENPDCDVIILTMFGIEAFKEAAGKVEASDFIEKSEIYDKLLPSIKKCLETRSSKIGK